MATPSPRYQRHLARLALAGDVYFVQAEKLRLIKIGYAKDAGERFRSLQVGSPDKLTLLGAIYSMNAQAMEAELHVRFARLRQHGEWFQPEDELLAFIGREVSDSSDSDMVYDAMVSSGYVTRSAA